MIGQNRTTRVACVGCVASQCDDVLFQPIRRKIQTNLDLARENVPALGAGHKVKIALRALSQRKRNLESVVNKTS